jgi:hypothetical protein
VGVQPKMTRIDPRHIPQDTLPVEFPNTVARSKRGHRAGVIPTIRYVDCPSCTNRKVPVVEGFGATEVVKFHYKALAGRTRVPCIASGLDASNMKPSPLA